MDFGCCKCTRSELCWSKPTQIQISYWLGAYHTAKALYLTLLFPGERSGGTPPQHVSSMTQASSNSSLGGGNGSDSEAHAPSPSPSSQTQTQSSPARPRQRRRSPRWTCSSRASRSSRTSSSTRSRSARAPARSSRSSPRASPSGRASRRRCRASRSTCTGNSKSSAPAPPVRTRGASSARSP